MPRQPLSLTLEQSELLCLAGILRMPFIPGIDTEWLKSLGPMDIVDSMSAAGQSLVDRGITRTEPDGERTVDPVVVSLVGGCAAPDASFAVTISVGEKRDWRHYYIQEEAGLIIEHFCPRPRIHTFTNLPDSVTLTSRVEELLGLGGQVSPECASGIVGDAHIVRARDRVKDGERGANDAARILMEGGLPEATAVQLTRTIMRPKANGAVAWFNRSGDADGFATLEGANGLWLLIPFAVSSESGAETQVKVEPVSG